MNGNPYAFRNVIILPTLNISGCDTTVAEPTSKLDNSAQLATAVADTGEAAPTATLPAEKTPVSDEVDPIIGSFERL